MDDQANAPTDVRHLVASIKMQMTRQYMHDLREFLEGGDSNRFQRMVINAGLSIQTGTPTGWAKHARTMLDYEYVEVYFATERAEMLEQLERWKL